MTHRPELPLTESHHEHRPRSADLESGLEASGNAFADEVVKNIPSDPATITDAVETAAIEVLADDDSAPPSTAAIVHRLLGER